MIVSLCICITSHVLLVSQVYGDYTCMNIVKYIEPPWCKNMKNGLLGKNLRSERRGYKLFEFNNNVENQLLYFWIFTSLSKNMLGCFAISVLQN